MKLQTLRLEQLRQFRKPFSLDHLEPGINLIHGPNESGKSTLVRAIRAAFFERYRSKAVDDLVPWGDSGAAPLIDLVFEHGGQRWQLTKQFLKGKRCDLRVGSEAWNGEEAEEKLANLLGYQFAKKGASKEEHWGIPGLLWVEQGTGQNIEQAAGHASDHLQTALNSLVGEVASSGGDEVIQAVEKQRSVLLTGTGRPKGDYAQLEQQRQQLEVRLAELNESIERYQSLVDRLGDLRDEQACNERERPWDEARRNLEQAQARLQEVAALQQQQQRDSESLSDIGQKLELLTQSRAQYQHQQQRLEERAAQTQTAEQALQSEQQKAPVLAAALAQAQKAYTLARQAVEKARIRDQRDRLQREMAQRENELTLLEKNITRAGGHEVQLSEARTARQKNQIDPASVQQLQKIRRALEEEKIRSESIATRLSWQLAQDSSLQLEGQVIEGQGEQLLLEESTLEIPGAGTLRITPGGDDLGKVRRQIERLTKDQQDQLLRLGVQSPAQAEQRLTRCQDAQAQIQRLEELLASVAPNGIERLDRQRKEARSALTRLRSDLQDLPETDADDAVSTLPAAESGLAATEQRLNEAEQASRHHETRFLKATHTRDSAQKEWQQLNTELTGAERQQQYKQLDRDIAQEEQRLQSLEREVANRKATIDLARPELLQQDITRYQATIEQLEKARQNRALEIRELQGRLEAWGAEGLEEKRNEVVAELEHTSRRYNELHRRAQALNLLLELLQSKRQALTRRLQAPLQKHLDHYLSVLFPQATLEVDDALIPGTFTRGNELGQVSELSFGAREQMGLISRLAYADLLREAGRPTLIILDDTLVHSDTRRLAGMKRILFDAAQRHQILLFTCHPENWRDLGVEARDLEALKAVSAS